MRPPELTAALVYRHPALVPEPIPANEQAFWDDLQPESKQIPVELPAEAGV